MGFEFNPADEDPHGECRHEIHQLQSELTTLRAQLAAAEERAGGVEGLQPKIATWVIQCFGELAMRPHERACRLLEEVIELAQAEGIDRSIVDRSVAHVYSKPPGEPLQESGGVAITFLAYLQAKGATFDAVAQTEFDRVQSKSPEHFRARQRVKAEVGMSDADTIDAALAGSMESNRTRALWATLEALLQPAGEGETGYTEAYRKAYGVKPKD